jgi:hypothetical protein
MSVIYIPRSCGGTLILNITPPVAPNATKVVQVTFRDGTAQARFRDGETQVTFRDGVTNAGGR